MITPDSFLWLRHGLLFLFHPFCWGVGSRLRLNVVGGRPPPGCRSPWLFGSGLLVVASWRSVGVISRPLPPSGRPHRFPIAT